MSEGWKVAFREACMGWYKRGRRYPCMEGRMRVWKAVLSGAGADVAEAAREVAVEMDRMELEILSRMESGTIGSQAMESGTMQSGTMQFGTIQPGLTR